LIASNKSHATSVAAGHRCHGFHAAIDGASAEQRLRMPPVTNDAFCRWVGPKKRDLMF
jgi:hypothetical protein